MAQRHLAELRTVLARVRRRWLAVRWLRGLARVVAAVCLGLLVILLVELILAPRDLAMVLVAGAALVATVGFGLRALRPLWQHPPDRRVARFVEERCPELGDRVVSATEIGESAMPTVFADLVLADAVERLRGIDLGRVVARSRLRSAALRGALATAVLGVVLAWGFDPISRVAQTAWLYAFPVGVTLDVEPGDVRVMAGQPVRVRARLIGAAPLRTPPTLSVLDGPHARPVRMRPTGDGYLAEFPSVTESFIYRVTAGTLTAGDYLVEALVAPRVRRIDVEYAYPAFTGFAPRVEEDGGDVFAPAGTAVRLLVHADKPIAHGALVLGNGRRLALSETGTGTLLATLVVERDESYTVEITDADGLTNPPHAEYVIRATLDRVPEVQVLRPGGDREITPLEEVTIQARAHDDYHVEALDLVYRVVGRSEQSLAFQVPPRVATVTGAQTIYVEDLDVEPGDFITYYARARDVGHAGQSTVARSDIFFLEVRPFENEFEEAQSQSGMRQNAEDVGDLADVQKQIIVATWRLDQATDAVARTDDIQAVAAAQRELRNSAAGAAERVLGRGRRRASGDAGPAPENAAMAAAVAAMTAAATALEDLDTEQAIPHELDALDQLLTAQASIRRTQVAMQRDQGTQSSGNQAEQDLSALFDRELRREQETHFETGSRPDQPPTGDDESDTLRRLRELARRQAELNRAMREGAGTDATESPDAADERRRVLARLTREQQRLREQLEELARQLARDQSSDGQSASSGQAGVSSPGNPGRGDELQQISDQMRRATSELRRRDTDTARQSGGRALEEMQRLERRLRGEAAGERSRALAELQLDAQMLAEAQGRMADEVRHVEDDNRGRSSRRRLADEKDDLADRVDRLEQALRDLADPDDGTGQRAPAEASAEGPTRAARDMLIGEEVGRRMRAGADRLRRSGGDDSRPGRTSAGGALHDEETALAGVLASVAGRLRRAAGHDDGRQRLADELEAVRALRQRLDQLQTDLGPRSGTQASPPVETSVPGEPGSSSAQAASPQGRPTSAGTDGQGNQPGRSDGQRSDTGGSGGSELASLRRELVDRLAQRPELLEELRQEDPALDRELEQWARHWKSGSAPGTDPSRQDVGNWSSLRRHLENALRQYEAQRSLRLADRELRDRVTAGSDEALPTGYRRLVDEYYRSLATGPVLP